MEFQNDQPIYMQIAAALKEDVVNGRFRAGDKLPSVREGSVLFEVSALTMQRAMQYLEAEGIIYPKKGIGYFVKEECIHGLREKLTAQRAGVFVREMKSCGMSLGEVHGLINEKWDEAEGIMEGV